MGSRAALDAGRAGKALVQRGGVVRGYAFPDDLKKRYARCGWSSAYQPQACG